jgi:probable rRNA maturation factor
MTDDSRDGPSVLIDVLVEAGSWPPRAELEALARRTVDAVLDETGASAPGEVELSLVFSDDPAVRELNARWRGKDKATNVLSFPAFPVQAGDELPPMLGDVVLAAETVAAEAAAEGKALADHLSHLIAHGVLHLMGYDHQDDLEADRMEDLERRVLARMGIEDPYR